MPSISFSLFRVSYEPFSFNLTTIPHYVCLCRSCFFIGLLFSTSQTSIFCHTNFWALRDHVHFLCPIQVPLPSLGQLISHSCLLSIVHTDSILPLQRCQPTNIWTQTLLWFCWGWWGTENSCPKKQSLFPGVVKARLNGLWASWSCERCPCPWQKS